MLIYELFFCVIAQDTFGGIFNINKDSARIYISSNTSFIKNKPIKFMYKLYNIIMKGKS